MLGEVEVVKCFEKAMMFISTPADNTSAQQSAAS